MEITFKIDHLDPLGQGVSKIGDQVTFIPKTLPGEEGTALVWRKAKGVQFATVRQITNSSPLRIEAECPHYEQCKGCSYLHTDYSKELEFKEKTFVRFLKGKPTIHPAPERLGYRNRIQLHFSGKKLGYIDSSTKEILDVPRCLLPLPSIQDELQGLYQEAKLHKRPGHLELYQTPNGELRKTYNKPYADGGFSQVNQAQNKVLKGLIKDQVKAGLTILELFGGDGNLSADCKPCNRWVIDRYPSGNKTPFITQDLYRPDSLKRIIKTVPNDIDLLILDPPRQGLKNLNDYAEHFTPKSIIYVSCNLQTQVRDLTPILENYRITEYHLIDLFPSTSHFETLIHLERS